MGGINSKEVEERMWSGGQSKPTGGKKTEGKKMSTSTKTKTTEEYKTGQELEVNEDEDHDSEDYDPKTAGPIFPDGNINWDCPCLGGAAYGPCGTEFRQAFSCFHFSKAEPKGTDCFPNFRDMHTCFSNYPDLYGAKEGEEDEDEDEDEMFDDEELEVIDKETEEKEKSKAQDQGEKQKEKEPEKTPKKSPEPSPAPDRKEIEGKPKDKEQVIPRGAAVL